MTEKATTPNTDTSTPPEPTRPPLKAWQADEEAATAAARNATFLERINWVAFQIGTLPKTGHNEEQNFDFIGVHQVVEAVNRLFPVAGITFTVTIERDGLTRDEVTSRRGAVGTRVLVWCTFRLEDSWAKDEREFVEATIPGEGVDYGDKAVQKAITSATKTFLMRTLSIAEDSPDPDSIDVRRAPGEARVYADGDEAPAEQCPVCGRKGMKVWSDRGDGHLFFKCTRKAKDPAQGNAKGYCTGTRNVPAEQVAGGAQQAPDAAPPADATPGPQEAPAPVQGPPAGDAYAALMALLVDPAVPAALKRQVFEQAGVDAEVTAQGQEAITVKLRALPEAAVRARAIQLKGARGHG